MSNKQIYESNTFIMAVTHVLVSMETADNSLLALIHVTTCARTHIHTEVHRTVKEIKESNKSTLKTHKHMEAKLKKGSEHSHTHCHTFEISPLCVCVRQNGKG